MILFIAYSSWVPSLLSLMLFSFDMQARISVFRLRPFALLVHRQLLYYRLGNLLVTDTSMTLRIP